MRYQTGFIFLEALIASALITTLLCAFTIMLNNMQCAQRALCVNGCAFKEVSVVAISNKPLPFSVPPLLVPEEIR